jgi:hypothetical protein
MLLIGLLALVILKVFPLICMGVLFYRMFTNLFDKKADTEYLQGILILAISFMVADWLAFFSYGIKVSWQTSTTIGVIVSIIVSYILLKRHLNEVKVNADGICS